MATTDLNDVNGDSQPQSDEDAISHPIEVGQAPPTHAQIGEGSAPSNCCGDELEFHAERVFIYTIGSIQARFPSLSVEREFSLAAQQEDTAKLNLAEAVYIVLKRNHYLAREVCWTLSVEGIEAYILLPKDDRMVDQLVEAIKPSEQRGADCDLVIGSKGALAPAEACNGLVIPTVFLHNIYSFEIPALIEAIPRPKGIDSKAFRAASEELFYKIMQMADNTGELDEHRALNYLALRYPRIYELTAQKYAEDASLQQVEVIPSRLSAARKLVDVVFSYVHRKTDVKEKHYVRVDVTEMYPFLASKLSPYYDRQ